MSTIRKFEEPHLSFLYADGVLPVCDLSAKYTTVCKPSLKAFVEMYSSSCSMNFLSEDFKSNFIFEYKIEPNMVFL